MCRDKTGDRKEPQAERGTRTSAHKSLLLLSVVFLQSQINTQHGDMHSTWHCVLFWPTDRWAVSITGHGLSYFTASKKINMIHVFIAISLSHRRFYYGRFCFLLHMMKTLCCHRFSLLCGLITSTDISSLLLYKASLFKLNKWENILLKN